MNTNNNILCPLDFHQDKSKRWGLDDEFGFTNFQLWCPQGHILPFFFEYGQNHLTSGNPTATLMDCCDNVIWSGNINSLITARDYNQSNQPPFTIRVSSILFNIPASVPVGRYYLQLDFGNGEVLYSDFFTTTNEPLLEVIFYDDTNFVTETAQIPYQYVYYYNSNGNTVTRIYQNYTQTLFFPANIGVPEYTYSEVATDRDGFLFVEKQLSEKKYKFKCAANEKLLDVMRLIRISDHVLITEKNGRQYICDNFLMTPEWLDNGLIAEVTCEFETNTVAKKIGRSINTVSGFGDYNNDFSNDFLI